MSDVGCGERPGDVKEGTCLDGKIKIVSVERGGGVYVVVSCG